MVIESGGMGMMHAAGLGCVEKLQFTVPHWQPEHIEHNLFTIK